MQAFENYNPIVITIYFLSVICILMFSHNPVFIIITFIGVTSYMSLQHPKKKNKSYIFYFILFMILSLINPIVSHNGRTVLFVVNDAPITLESIIYGVVSGGGIVCAILLFRSYTIIMTIDKLLYIFGRLSPKISLIMSMGIRYVGLLRERWQKIKMTQRALGLYNEDNIFNKIKSDLRVFSILVTWSLENGIITADSMAARGYGRKRRTFYSNHLWKRTDSVLLLVILLCPAVIIYGMISGSVTFTYYPDINMSTVTPVSVITYCAFGLLAMLPTILEMEERIRWNYLQSKI